MNRSKLETLRNEQYISLGLTKEEKKLKREKLKARVEELYPNLPKLTIKDYARLSEKYNSGDESVIPEVMERSLNTIFMAVVYLYSAYDFSKLEFEDALGYAYENAYDLIFRNDKNQLDKTKRQYEGVIAINTKLYLSRIYQKMLRHNAHLAFDDYDNDYKEEFDQERVDLDLQHGDIVRIIKSCYERFTDEEKEIFNMTYKLKFNDQTIADKIGRSVPSVRYIRTIMKNKIKKVVEAKGIEIDRYSF